MKNREKNNQKDDNKYYFEQQIVYIEHVETILLVKKMQCVTNINTQ